MKLIEIEGAFKMDYGAPNPLIIANDLYLLVAFQGGADTFEEEHVICLDFPGPRKHRFGRPNDETISGHPYYQLGLMTGGFYELENSDWIAELQKIASLHQYYDPNKWSKLKHYILTFHDNMFECVAESFTVLESKEDLYQQVYWLLQDEAR
jgi:hypothetical protein